MSTEFNAVAIPSPDATVISSGSKLNSSAATAISRASSATGLFSPWPAWSYPWSELQAAASSKPAHVDGLAEQIRRWTGNRAQVIGRTRKEIARLRRAKEPIHSEWTRDLVVIAGERTALGKVA